MKDNSNFIKDIMEKVFGTKKLEPTFTVTKDLYGEYRWVGISTNRYIDREGEILSDASHVEFEKYLDSNPKHEVKLMLWHEPLSAMEKAADFYAYDKQNGFFFYSGILTEQEAKMLEGIDDARMSHGFYVLERNGHIITKYRSTEVSVLPGKYVANSYTEFTSEYLKEDSNMFESESKRAFFVERWGEEKVAGFEADAESKANALATMHTEFKELEETYLKEMDDKMAEDVAEAAQPMVKEIVAEVVEAMDLKGLNETITGFQEQAKENAGLAEQVAKLTEMVEFLKSTEDDKLAKALTPEAPFSFAWSPTKSNDNIIEDEDVDEAIKSEVKSTAPDWMTNVGQKGQFGGA